MFAIQTKWVAPTNTKPARIAVDDGDNRTILSYPDAESKIAAHRIALETHLIKHPLMHEEYNDIYNWVAGEWFSGYAFVYAPTPTAG